jgi:tRNA(Ile2) C34 agmatinyltransferase TiaS
MRILVGFDDTDNLDSDYGTGKVARWFANELPEGCRVWGVVRQQLLVDDAIPYTSHNSAACVVIEASRNGSVLAETVAQAAAHVVRHAAEGSDPGVCAAAEDSPALGRLMTFGLACTRSVMSQEDARGAAAGVHLSGYGGTNGGVIGAAAAVGLTAAGWYGRFIEFGDLRRMPTEMGVAELQAAGIRVVSMDRDAFVPRPGDQVLTQGWVRPRLLGGQPVLTLVRKEPGVWETMGGRRGHKGTPGRASS